MKIILDQVSKRYNLHWIFKQVNYTFLSNNQYAILGENGSGKSTLMKIISSQLSPSQGNISFHSDTSQIDPLEFYASLSFVAPYIDLIDAFTLKEMFDFHRKFKSQLKNLHEEDIYSFLEIKNQKQKLIKNFSSGMKQKVKLGLAFLSNTPLLLFDEPTTNLDQAGIDWYLRNIELVKKSKIILIASNQNREYDFCSHIIQMQDYK